MATPPIAIITPFSCTPLIVFLNYLFSFPKTALMTMGAVFVLCEHPADFNDLSNDVNNGTIHPGKHPWWT